MPFSSSHKIVVSYQSVGDCAFSLFSYSVLEISVIGVRMHGEGKIVPMHVVKARGGAWRYNPTLLNLGARYRSVVNFLSRTRNLERKITTRCALNKRLGGGGSVPVWACWRRENLLSYRESSRGLSVLQPETRSSHRLLPTH